MGKVEMEQTVPEMERRLRPKVSVFLLECPVHGEESVNSSVTLKVEAEGRSWRNLDVHHRS